MSSVIDERTLREIYLMPFELAVKEGGALGVMTAYNRVNGAWCTERPDLLAGILREEWGFEGFVLTDWFGVAGTVASAQAGVDLEMPGPGRAFGEALAEAVRSGELDEAVLDGQVRRLLTVFERIGALDSASEEAEDVEADDLPEHRALAREAARSSIVLLRNQGVLPFDPAALRRVAVVGPNAGRAVIMGGGSAQVTPHYRLSPVEAVRQRLGDGAQVVHEPGVDVDVAVPALRADLELTFHAGSDLETLGQAAEPVYEARRPVAEMLWFGSPDRAVPKEFVLQARGVIEPTVTGPHRLTLAQSGRARVRIDGTVVLDGVTEPPPRGTSFLGMGSQEIETTVDLEAGRRTEVVVEYSSAGSGRVHAVKVGCVPVPPPDLLDRAVAAARHADAAIVVVGTTREWESEGFDRTSLHLPGDQDDLVARIAAVNPNTVVVVNTGSPVAMPWVDEVGAILQVWFGGQEMSGGLVDVLLGDVDPGGRLPTTFPRRLEHNPSFGTFPGANDENRYGEGLLVGYRWYDTRDIDPLFPFGHGLSYTTFEIGVPVLSAATFTPGDELAIDIPVANTGPRTGATVVQCYVAPVEPPVLRPRKELKAFGKVTLGPGQGDTVRLVLGDRAFARWDPGPGDGPALRARVPEVMTSIEAPASDGGPEARAAGWCVDPGPYELHIGWSSVDVRVIVPIEVQEQAPVP
jgi:beta-glucosidase